MQRVHGIRKPGSALARAGRSLVTAVCLGSLAAAQFLVFATTSAAPVRAASDPVLMAAGDIGCDPTTNTPANCPMNNTAALINSAKPGYVLALGDIQYTDNLPPGSPPTPSMYLQGYDSAWGQIPASVPGVSINPTAGNHDWGDPNDTNSSSGATLANYISYFNEFSRTLNHEHHAWRISRAAKDRLKEDIKEIIRAVGSEGKASAIR